jgi:transcription antitermination protein NusB
MQHVYAYKQCQRSNLELAYQHIHDAYEPDLNSMEVQDREQLARERQVATQLLDLYFDNQPLINAEEKHIEKVEAEGLLYEKQCRKDQEFLLNQMISTTERVADHYRLFLLLLVELAEESHRDQQKKMSLTRQAAHQTTRSAIQTNFYLNRAIQALRDSHQLHQQVEKRKLNWNNSHVEIRQWYKNLVKPDQEFQNYQAKEETNLEEDIQIVRHLFNQVILKSDPIVTVFEEIDINWQENSKAIKSMVNKSMKSVQEDSDELEIVDLTPNWEDDKEFLVSLYRLTLENDMEYEKIIRDKVENWAVDRIASLDSVIIKMAITEMIHFSSIPVKVTINEYIDLSKNYSTQKSKQFVNGMLDVISQELQAKKLIRKSGRGLIDNQ